MLLGMRNAPAEVDTIKVLIAEDDSGARAALAQLIESEPSLILIGQAADAAQAIQLAATHRPDVALIDVRMPLGGGARATREIRLCSPDTRVLALSFHEDRETVLEMIRAGAEGYLVKGGSPREIIEAIHSSARGGSRLSDRVTREVVQELAGQLKRLDTASARDRMRTERIRLLVHGIGVRLAFQPIVDLSDGRILGVEALARFSDPTVRGPSEWLAEAEDLGMRTALELTILKATLGRVEDLPPGTFLAVNLSPTTLASTPLVPLMRRAPMDRIVLIFRDLLKDHILFSGEILHSNCGAQQMRQVLERALREFGNDIRVIGGQLLRGKRVVAGADFIENPVDVFPAVFG